jgi:hypothetical protein
MELFRKEKLKSMEIKDYQFVGPLCNNKLLRKVSA